MSGLHRAAQGHDGHDALVSIFPEENHKSDSLQHNVPPVGRRLYPHKPTDVFFRGNSGTRRLSRPISPKMPTDEQRANFPNGKRAAGIAKQADFYSKGWSFDVDTAGAKKVIPPYGVDAMDQFFKRTRDADTTGQPATACSAQRQTFLKSSIFRNLQDQDRFNYERDANFDPEGQGATLQSTRISPRKRTYGLASRAENGAFLPQKPIKVKLTRSSSPAKEDYPIIVEGTMHLESEGDYKKGHYRSFTSGKECGVRSESYMGSPFFDALREENEAQRRMSTEIRERTKSHLQKVLDGTINVDERARIRWRKQSYEVTGKVTDTRVVYDGKNSYGNALAMNRMPFAGEAEYKGMYLKNIKQTSPGGEAKSSLGNLGKSDHLNKSRTSAAKGYCDADTQSGTLLNATRQSDDLGRTVESQYRNEFYNTNDIHDSYRNDSYRADDAPRGAHDDSEVGAQDEGAQELRAHQQAVGKASQSLRYNHETEKPDITAFVESAHCAQVDDMHTSSRRTSIRKKAVVLTEAELAQQDMDTFDRAQSKERSQHRRAERSAEKEKRKQSKERDPQEQNAQLPQHEEKAKRVTQPVNIALRAPGLTPEKATAAYAHLEGQVANPAASRGAMARSLSGVLRSPPTAAGRVQVFSAVGGHEAERRRIQDRQLITDKVQARSPADRKRELEENDPGKADLATTTFGMKHAIEAVEQQDALRHVSQALDDYHSIFVPEKNSAETRKGAVVLIPEPNVPATSPICRSPYDREKAKEKQKDWDQDGIVHRRWKLYSPLHNKYSASVVSGEFDPGSGNQIGVNNPTYQLRAPKTNNFEEAGLMTKEQQTLNAFPGKQFMLEQTIPDESAWQFDKPEIQQIGPGFGVRKKQDIGKRRESSNFGVMPSLPRLSTIGIGAGLGIGADTGSGFGGSPLLGSPSSPGTRSNRGTIVVPGQDGKDAFGPTKSQTTPFAILSKQSRGTILGENKSLRDVTTNFKEALQEGCESIRVKGKLGKVGSAADDLDYRDPLDNFGGEGKNAGASMSLALGGLQAKGTRASSANTSFAKGSPGLSPGSNASSRRQSAADAREQQINALKQSLHSPQAMSPIQEKVDDFGLNTIKESHTMDARKSQRCRRSISPGAGGSPGGSSRGKSPSWYTTDPGSPRSTGSNWRNAKGFVESGINTNLAGKTDSDMKTNMQVNNQYLMDTLLKGGHQPGNSMAALWMTSNSPLLSTTIGSAILDPTAFVYPGYRHNLFSLTNFIRYLVHYFDNNFLKVWLLVFDPDFKSGRVSLDKFCEIVVRLGFRASPEVLFHDLLKTAAKNREDNRLPWPGEEDARALEIKELQWNRKLQKCKDSMMEAQDYRDKQELLLRELGTSEGSTQLEDVVKVQKRLSDDTDFKSSNTGEASLVARLQTKRLSVLHDLKIGVYVRGGGKAQMKALLETDSQSMSQQNQPQSMQSTTNVASGAVQQSTQCGGLQQSTLPTGSDRRATGPMAESSKGTASGPITLTTNTTTGEITFVDPATTLEPIHTPQMHRLKKKKVHLELWDFDYDAFVLLQNFSLHVFEYYNEPFPSIDEAEFFLICFMRFESDKVDLATFTRGCRNINYVLRKKEFDQKTPNLADVLRTRWLRERIQEIVQAQKKVQQRLEKAEREYAERRGFYEDDKSSEAQSENPFEGLTGVIKSAVADKDASETAMIFDNFRKVFEEEDDGKDEKLKQQETVFFRQLAKELGLNMPQAPSAVPLIAKKKSIIEGGDGDKIGFAKKTGGSAFSGDKNATDDKDKALPSYMQPTAAASAKAAARRQSFNLGANKPSMNPSTGPLRAAVVGDGKAAEGLVSLPGASAVAAPSAPQPKRRASLAVQAASSLAQDPKTQTLGLALVQEQQPKRRQSVMPGLGGASAQKTGLLNRKTSNIDDNREHYVSSFIKDLAQTQAEPNAKNTMIMKNFQVVGNQPIAGVAQSTLDNARRASMMVEASKNGGLVGGAATAAPVGGNQPQSSQSAFFTDGPAHTSLNPALASLGDGFLKIAAEFEERLKEGRSEHSKGSSSSSSEGSEELSKQASKEDSGQEARDRTDRGDKPIGTPTTPVSPNSTVKKTTSEERKQKKELVKSLRQINKTFFRIHKCTTKTLSRSIFKDHGDSEEDTSPIGDETPTREKNLISGVENLLDHAAAGNKDGAQILPDGFGDQNLQNAFQLHGLLAQMVPDNKGAKEKSGVRKRSFEAGVVDSKKKQVGMKEDNSPKGKSATPTKLLSKPGVAGLEVALFGALPRGEAKFGSDDSNISNPFKKSFQIVTVAKDVAGKRRTSDAEGEEAAKALGNDGDASSDNPLDNNSDGLFSHESDTTNTGAKKEVKPILVKDGKKDIAGTSEGDDGEKFERLRDLAPGERDHMVSAVRMKIVFRAEKVVKKKAGVRKEIKAKKERRREDMLAEFLLMPLAGSVKNHYINTKSGSIRWYALFKDAYAANLERIRRKAGKADLASEACRSYITQQRTLCDLYNIQEDPLERSFRIRKERISKSNPKPISRKTGDLSYVSVSLGGMKPMGTTTTLDSGGSRKSNTERNSGSGFTTSKRIVASKGSEAVREALSYVLQRKASTEIGMSSSTMGSQQALRKSIAAQSNVVDGAVSQSNVVGGAGLLHGLATPVRTSASAAPASKDKDSPKEDGELPERGSFRGGSFGPDSNKCLSGLTTTAGTLVSGGVSTIESSSTLGANRKDIVAPDSHLWPRQSQIDRDRRNRKLFNLLDVDKKKYIDRRFLATLLTNFIQCQILKTRGLGQKAKTRKLDRIGKTISNTLESNEFMEGLVDEYAEEMRKIRHNEKILSSPLQKTASGGALGSDSSSMLMNRGGSQTFGTGSGTGPMSPGASHVAGSSMGGDASKKSSKLSPSSNPTKSKPKSPKPRNENTTSQRHEGGGLTKHRQDRPVLFAKQTLEGRHQKLRSSVGKVMTSLRLMHHIQPLQGGEGGSPDSQGGSTNAMMQQANAIMQAGGATTKSMTERMVQTVGTQQGGAAAHMSNMSEAQMAEQDKALIRRIQASTAHHSHGMSNAYTIGKAVHGDQPAQHPVFSFMDSDLHSKKSVEETTVDDAQVKAANFAGMHARERNHYIRKSDKWQIGWHTAGERHKFGTRLKMPRVDLRMNTRKLPSKQARSFIQIQSSTLENDVKFNRTFEVRTDGGGPVSSTMSEDKKATVQGGPVTEEEARTNFRANPLIQPKLEVIRDPFRAAQCHKSMFSWKVGIVNEDKRVLSPVSNLIRSSDIGLETSSGIHRSRFYDSKIRKGFANVADINKYPMVDTDPNNPKSPKNVATIRREDPYGKGSGAYDGLVYGEKAPNAEVTEELAKDGIVIPIVDYPDFPNMSVRASQRKSDGPDGKGGAGENIAESGGVGRESTQYGGTNPTNNATNYTSMNIQNAGKVQVRPSAGLFLRDGTNTAADSNSTNYSAAGVLHVGVDYNAPGFTAEEYLGRIEEGDEGVPTNQAQGLTRAPGQKPKTPTKKFNRAGNQIGAGNQSGNQQSGESPLTLPSTPRLQDTNRVATVNFKLNSKSMVGGNSASQASGNQTHQVANRPPQPGNRPAQGRGNRTSVANLAGSGKSSSPQNRDTTSANMDIGSQDPRFPVGARPTLNSSSFARQGSIDVTAIPGAIIPQKKTSMTLQGLPLGASNGNYGVPSPGSRPAALPKSGKKGHSQSAKFSPTAKQGQSQETPRILKRKAGTTVQRDSPQNENKKISLT